MTGNAQVMVMKLFDVGSHPRPRRHTADCSNGLFGTGEELNICSVTFSLDISTAIDCGFNFSQ